MGLRTRRREKSRDSNVEHTIEIRDGEPGGLKAHVFAIIGRQTKNHRSHSVLVPSRRLYRTLQTTRSEILRTTMGEIATMVQPMFITTVTQLRRTQQFDRLY
jgi:hypothetical protein